MTDVVSEVRSLQGYVSKTPTAESASEHLYIIVKGDDQCIGRGEGLVLLRPVLKRNFDNIPQLNFHVWFHCVSRGSSSEHVVFGWRLEAPEGEGASGIGEAKHNFYHAQPLLKFGPSQAINGLHREFPERFPTFPLPASSVVELCLTAVLVAGGKEALRTMVRNPDPSLRHAAKEFWTKVFGTEGGDAPLKHQ